MRPRERTAREPTTLDAPRRHGLHPSKVAARVRCPQLGTLAASRGGNPRADAPEGQAARPAPRAPGRDVVSLQYGWRPQPGGLGPSLGLPGRRVRVGDEVLSNGQLQQWGKTEHSTKRRTAMPSLLQEDLCEWRVALSHADHPVRDVDFILPGNLAGPNHGVRDAKTGACHVSESAGEALGR